MRLMERIVRTDTEWTEQEEGVSPSMPLFSPRSSRLAVLILFLHSPNTPLSASDFAEAYGRNDWDTSSSLGPSTTTSPNLPRPSHIRDAASFDLSPSQSPNHLSSSPMEARTGSAISATSSYTGEDGDTSREEVYTDAHAGTSPNPGAMFEKSGLQLDTGDHLENVPPRSAENDLLTPTNGPASNPVSPTAAGRSITPKGDAKARAAAFIADLKKARQEAASPENQRNVQTEEDDTIRIETKEREVPQAAISPIAERPPPVPAQQQQSSSSSLPRPVTRTSESPLPHPPQPSSRSSMLPPSRQTSHNTTYAPPPLPPLLRRRPLPMAIQASGELKKARTAGDRARIYASKINELSREKSRLNEWIEAVRNPRLAIGRGELHSLHCSLRYILTDETFRDSFPCISTRFSTQDRPLFPSRCFDRNFRTSRRRISSERDPFSHVRTKRYDPICTLPRSTQLQQYRHEFDHFDERFQ